MENPNKENIDDLIEYLCSKLKDTQPGDKQWNSISSTLEKMYELRSDEIAKANSLSIEEDKLYNDEKVIEAKFKEADKERRNTIIFRCLEIGIPTITYVGIYLAGLNFEKTGYLSSQMVRNFLQKLPLPKGKQPK